MVAITLVWKSDRALAVGGVAMAKKAELKGIVKLS